MEFYDEPWIHDWFDPLDLLKVLGYPKQIHGYGLMKDYSKNNIQNNYGHKIQL